MKLTRVQFCPYCGGRLPADDTLPKRCVTAGCDFELYDNPVPVVAAIVELPEGVVLVRERSWPQGMFGLVTGFLERGEAPDAAVLREVREELSLVGRACELVGLYPFEAFNQLLIAYHVDAQGEIRLDSDELADYRIIPRGKLKAWSFGTGLAVRDWLARVRGG
jgi:NADH pyrophosphatase NudC (nudix superfamily)